MVLFYRSGATGCHRACARQSSVISRFLQAYDVTFPQLNYMMMCSRIKACYYAMHDCHALVTHAVRLWGIASKMLGRHLKKVHNGWFSHSSVLRVPLLSCTILLSPVGFLDSLVGPCSPEKHHCRCHVTPLQSLLLDRG